MENVLYHSTIVPAAESPDGETATILYVCQESNAAVVWLESYDGGLEFIKHFRYNPHQAIEFAVDEARRRREEIERVKAALAALNPPAPPQPLDILTDDEIPF
jgi:hypothetical protein